ncbi:MAG: polymer-forming cytoskeletal protein [Chloroflexota bacterium]|nr:polymer-forming cytoskeletal protein [Chloroflexota bacterium]
MSMRSVEPQSYGLQGQDDYGSEQEAESISVIDRFSNFDGTFHSTRDLRIEGQVKGTIDCQGTLHVAQGANVNAKVEAENISVAGDLDGDINCRGRLQMLPSGRVRGKIQTVTLVINEGAYYEGQLEMAPPESRLSAGRGASRSRAGVGGSSPVPIASAASEAARPGNEPNPGGNTFIRRFGERETSWEAGRAEQVAADEEQ